MASIQFIEKRIAGKKVEIEKLNKKLDRILKAQATGWNVNPYYYDERDLKYTKKDLEAAVDALVGYEKQLAEANQKAASRNVPVILEFLEGWKNQAKEFYVDHFPKYLKAYEEYREAQQKYTDWWNKNGFRTRRENPEEYKQREREQEEHSHIFHSTWNFIAPYVYRDRNCKLAFDMIKLEKDLNDEANRKYDFIIERTNAIVGTITDASHLYVGDKGDLNGYIIGTDGVAKVQTIGAGGYNIQCFHFRTLIKRMKAEETKDVSKKTKQTKKHNTTVTKDTNFKAMSLEELEALANEIGAEYKHYDNRGIYRMRLTMAVKAKLS